MSSHHQPTDPPAEVVIIGASFAGLAAALLLGRAQRHVVVLGDGPTRNAEAEHAHNLPTREGTPPADLLALAAADVDVLPTVTRHVAVVSSVELTTAGGLLVRTTDDRVWSARHVILATGARDGLPRIPGLPAVWGRRAHSCPFCDAAPYAGRRLAVLADEPVASHLRSLLTGWTDDVVPVAPADVQGIDDVTDGVLLHRTDGSEVVVDGIFVHVTPLPRTTPVDGLELERRGDFVATDAGGRTSQPGLWAVGDCAWPDGSPMPGGQILAAMAGGSRAGIETTLELAGLEMPTPPARSERITGGHGGAHQHQDSGTDASLASFWEDLYAEQDRIWSGRPNVGLVSAVGQRPPGRALDLGAGEGGDTIWLAEQGWQVSAVDVAPTAIARLEAIAADRGVSDLVTGVVQDLASGPVDGTFDLVVAAYLLSPVEIPRDQILREASRAVAPGGIMVVLSHLPTDGLLHRHEMTLPSIAEQVRGLELDEGWEIRQADAFERRAQTHDGAIVTMLDSVVVAARRAG